MSENIRSQGKYRWVVRWILLTVYIVAAFSMYLCFNRGGQTCTVYGYECEETPHAGCGDQTTETPFGPCDLSPLGCYPNTTKYVNTGPSYVHCVDVILPWKKCIVKPGDPILCATAYTCLPAQEGGCEWRRDTDKDKSEYECI